MDLQEELIKLKKQLNTKFPAAVINADKKIIQELGEKRNSFRRPKAGDRLDVFEENFNFSLPDVRGNLVELEKLLEAGPVVLSFNRGNWCPYCNLEMKVLRSNSDAIRKLGGQLVAVSPDILYKPRVANEEDTGFYLLSDRNNKIAKKLGLSFEVPAYLFKAYKEVGINLEEYQGEKKAVLPVPATFVIDSSGTFVFAFASEDFTRRASISEILSALAKIRKGKENS